MTSSPLLVAAGLGLLATLLPGSAAATSDCYDFTVEQTQPDDGTTGVPPRATLRFVFDDENCSPSIATEVECTGGDVVASVEEDRDFALVEVTPPFGGWPTRASCVLRVVETYDDIVEHEIAFEVASTDVSPAPPAPPSLVSAELGHHVRDEGLQQAHKGTVTVLVAPDPLGMSLVRVVERDTGEVRALELAPAAGGEVRLDVSRIVNDTPDEACFRIEHVDAVEAVVAAEVCAASEVLPPVNSDEGCSVGAAPGGARQGGGGTSAILALLAAVALSVAARRR